MKKKVNFAEIADTAPTTVFRKTYLVCAVMAQIVSPHEYRHKLPVVFKVHILCSVIAENERDGGKGKQSHGFFVFLGGRGGLTLFSLKALMRAWVCAGISLSHGGNKRGS